MKKLLGAICFLFITSQTQAAETILITKDYILKANRPLETGLLRVPAEFSKVDKVGLKQQGEYCDIRLDGVEYRSEENGPVRSAEASGNRYLIPQGTLYSVNMQFTQRSYNNAPCKLIIVGEGAGASEYGFRLLKEIPFSSLPYQKTLLLSPAVTVKELAILPSVGCGVSQVKVNDLSTIVAGVDLPTFKSTTYGPGYYFVPGEKGDKNVEGFTLWLDGPSDLKQCKLGFYLREK